jgi:MFS family permease
VGKGLRGAPRDALIADAAGDRTGRAFGFHQAMDNVGAVFGPLVATLLVAGHVPIRHIFWIAVVPGAVATALVALVREPARTALPPATSPAVDGRLERPLVVYLVILAVFSLGNSSDAFLLLRARSVGLSTAAIPVLWAVLNLSKVAWAYVGGEWADRVPRARLIAVGWIVYAVVYVGLGAAAAPWHIWVLFVLYGVFYGLTEPVEKALVKDLAPPTARGRAYGVFNFVVGITALPAGLLTGGLWRMWGPAVALGTSAVLSAVAALLLLQWDRRRARR